MNKKIIIFIVILFVAIAGAVYMAKRSDNQNIITESDLEVYKNKDYGIEFSYPDKYVLEEKEVGNAERGHYSIMLISKEDKERLTSDTPPGEGPTGITIDIFQNDIDKLTIDNWVKNTNDSNFKLSPDGFLGLTSVGGTEALTYSWSGLYAANSVVFEHKKNIVMMSMTYVDSADDIWRHFPIVLQSVKLTD